MTIYLASAVLGFPIWLRLSHFINLLFIGLVIRSGIQILGAHPRLYWNNSCKPGTDWLNFTHKKIPQNRLWTSMDEADYSKIGEGQGGFREDVQFYSTGAEI